VREPVRRRYHRNWLKLRDLFPEGDCFALGAEYTVTMYEGAIELLLRARELVGLGWTQDADARAADGNAVDPWEERAVSWSLLGAIVAALEERSTNGRDLPLEHLALALGALEPFVDDDSLAHWNDAGSRTQDAVAAVLSAAANAAAERLRAPPTASPN
jgi:hypothetical protein